MKSKYHVGLDQVAYDAIALTGTDIAGVEAVGIDETTFYKWVTSKPSFKAAIASAKEFHRKCSPDIQRLRLLTYMVKALEAGYQTASYRTRTTSRTTRRDSLKRVLWTDEQETVIEHTEQKPLQKWIADKIMPDAGDLEDSVKRVLNAGLRVSDPTLAPVGAGRILNDQDIEAIASIKENLLFGVQN